MSEENIKLTAIIRVDIRNPFSKLVASSVTLGSEYGKTLYPEEDFTKDSLLGMFRKIKVGRFMRLGIFAYETTVIHSLQELSNSKAKIDEIEILAQDVQSKRIEDFKDLYNPTGKIITTVGTLKLPRTQIKKMVPWKDASGDLIYYLEFNLSGGSSMVSY